MEKRGNAGALRSTSWEPIVNLEFYLGPLEEHHSNSPSNRMSTENNCVFPILERRKKWTKEGHPEKRPLGPQT
jgi:hypothetical protein